MSIQRGTGIESISEGVIMKINQRTQLAKEGRQALGEIIGSEKTRE